MAERELSKKELLDLVYSGKELRGYFNAEGFKYIGHCADQYAQYSVYQNDAGEVLYKRYADMD